jgi:ligand-binding sensor domain-containing protein
MERSDSKTNLTHLAAALALALAAAACTPPAAASDGPPYAKPASGDRPAPVTNPDPKFLPEPLPLEPIVYDRWETVGRENGLPSDKVLAVLCDGPHVWVGTENGLVCVEDGKLSVWGTQHGLAHRVVSALAKDGRTGDLWIGTFGGVSRFSGGKFTTFKQTTSGLMNDVVYAITCEGDRVWFATAGGGSRYDKVTDQWGVFDHTNAIFHEPWTYGVAAGLDHIWWGVWAGGVCEHDPVTGSWKEYRDPDGEFELDLVPDDGPIHDVTSSLTMAEGIVWQATYFGLSRFEKGRWRSFLKKDGGLPSDFINTVQARGRWALLATDEGFCVTDGDNWTSYGRNDDGTGAVRLVRPGRPVEVRAPTTTLAHRYCFASDAQGREVWVGTAKGLAHGISTPPAAPQEKSGGR